VTAYKTRLGSLAAALAIAALPAGAAAAPYVPPGNSAATQYTEAVPTAGGPKATDKGKQGKNRSPGKVLGVQNTEKLDAQGAEGRAVAEVAAATAPVPLPVQPTAPATVHAAPSESAGTANAQTADSPAQAQIPSGSSGLGEVLGQATGSSSGELGLLLPLLIVAVVIWSVAYLLRQRRDRPAA
jgi:hypothetical protein